MAGWSQATQASQRPSGEGRGADTKSGPETTGTTDWVPSTGSATRRCEVADPSTVSSIEINHRPELVRRPSACRTDPAEGSGDRATGGPSWPMGIRYHLWSAWST